MNKGLCELSDNFFWDYFLECRSIKNTKILTRESTIEAPGGVSKKLEITIPATTEMIPMSTEIIAI